MGVELKILIMDVEFDGQFDDWAENVLVRFLFGFGVEVEKSLIFQ